MRNKANDTAYRERERSNHLFNFIKFIFKLVTLSIQLLDAIITS